MINPASFVTSFLGRVVVEGREQTPRRGSRLTKDRKGSTRKIDLCIASIIALHRAAFWRDEAPPETQLLVL